MSDWLLPGLELREPLWLLLMPLCWALWRFPGRQDSPPARFRAYAEPRLLRWLVVDSGGPARSRLTLLAWLLIVAGISGPYLVERGSEQTRSGIDIAVVIDISPSMRVADVAPDRLRRARLELEEFLERLGADRVALIAFSAHAYRLLPLSTDKALLPWYLEALDPSLTRLRGSNLTAALELASRTLDGSGNHRAIVLLSDGELADPPAALAAADRLAARGLPLFALGVATETGGPVPASRGYLRGEDGQYVVSHLDRPLLEQLASRTGGRYADLRADDRDWDRLFAGLDELERAERSGSGTDPGTTLAPVLFALALVLLIAAIRRPPQPALPVLALLLCTVLMPAGADATPWAEQAALDALESGRYLEAAERYRDIEGFRGRLGEGAAAYRLGDWRTALRHFNDAERIAAGERQRATALYNRANTLARLNRLEAARDDYDRVLELQPDHRRASRNRSVVQRLLERPAPAGRAEEQVPRRLDPTTDNLSRGEIEDPRAAGEDRAAQNGGAGAQPGGGDSAGVLPGDARQPTGSALGEQAQAALARIDGLGDDAGEVLRHRFRVLDAKRQFVEQPKPW